MGPRRCRKHGPFTLVWETQRLPQASWLATTFFEPILDLSSALAEVMEVPGQPGDIGAPERFSKLSWPDDTAPTRQRADDVGMSVNIQPNRG